VSDSVFNASVYSALIRPMAGACEWAVEFLRKDMVRVLDCLAFRCMVPWQIKSSPSPIKRFRFKLCADMKACSSKCETRNEAALQSLHASFALLAFTVPVMFRYLVSFLAVACSDDGAAAGSFALGST
jgi:hypothetical protein